MPARRLPYVVLAACSVVYFIPFLRLLSHNGDEGTLILGAARVTEGQLPFRDFFEVMGPGTFYWLALFFKLLGTTWFATRICLLFTTTAIVLLLFYLSRRLRSGIETAAVVLFVAVSYHGWNAVSHHMGSILFGLLAFAAMMFWIDRRRSWILFVAGLAAGVTTWFMLQKGLLLCLSFVLLLWILCRKDSGLWPSLTALLGGYLLVIGGVLVLFWRAGGLPDLVYSNILWPFLHYSGVNHVPYGLEFGQLYWTGLSDSIRQVSTPVVAIVITSILCFPFLVVMGLPLVLVAFIVRYRRSAFHAEILPYWLVGFAFWFSEMHRKDVLHVVYGSPVLIVLALYFCSRIRTGRMRQLLQLVSICSVALAALRSACGTVRAAPGPTRRGVVYTFEGSPVLDFLDGHVAPGEPVFVYPYAPMYYFLSGAKNPTRYSILMYRMNTVAQFHEVVQSLEANKVRYVMWDQSFPEWASKSFPAYHIPPADQLIVEPYLTQHYRVVGGGGGYQFLERRVH